MFGLILIAVCTVMNVYVVWRTTTVPSVTAHVPVRWILLTGFFLWILLVAGRLYGRHNPEPIAVAVEFVGMTWLAALFLLFLCLLAVDVVTLFGFLFPGIAPTLRGIALAAGLVLTAVGLFQGLRAPVITSYTVEMEKLPPELDGTTVAVLSDLHLGSQRGVRWLNGRIDQVNVLQPDIVFLLGDVFEGRGDDQDSFTPVMRRLKPGMGAYAVLGNHEFHGEGDKGERLTEASGFEVLRNRWIQAGPGLVIAGVDDLTTRSRRNMDAEDYVEKALAGRPDGAAILLSHSPLDADKAAAAGVGLMLSGHTHGGQIWPFGYLVGTVYPYVYGRYELGGMTIIVTGGAGLWGPPVRLWRPGEIVHITIRRAGK